MNLDMLPMFSVDNGPYRLLMDSVFLGQSESFDASCVRFPYLYHLRFFQFMCSTSLAAIIYWLMASFIPGVFLIFSTSSQEQMVGSDAWRRIACMANLLAFWYWSEMQFPRSNMRGDIFALPFSLDAAISITTIIAPNPKPTTIGFVNEFPKSLIERNSFVRGLVSTYHAAKSLFRGDANIENAIAL